jgi:hypothetical protein
MQMLHFIGENIVIVKSEPKLFFRILNQMETLVGCYLNLHGVNQSAISSISAALVSIYTGQARYLHTLFKDDNIINISDL